jgi:septal ring factor EnvC (AmiA/AmiB activator)
MAKAKAQQVKVDLPATEVKPEEKARTLQDIQSEFSALCTRAGHLTYQAFTFQKDVDLLNNRMRELNFEAAALQGAKVGEKQADANG